MNKEELLEKSRKENKNRDEREKGAAVTAGFRAAAVGGMVCMVILLLDIILTDEWNGAVWAVYLSITGSTLLFRFIALRRRHELVFGVMQLALAAAFLAGYIIKLVK